MKKFYSLENRQKINNFRRVFLNTGNFFEFLNVRITIKRALIWYITQSSPINNCGTWFCVKNNKKKLKHTRIQSSSPFSMAETRNWNALLAAKKKLFFSLRAATVLDCKTRWITIGKLNEGLFVTNLLRFIAGHMTSKKIVFMSK